MTDEEIGLLSDVLLSGSSRAVDALWHHLTARHLPRVEPHAPTPVGGGRAGWGQRRRDEGRPHLGPRKAAS